MFHGSGGSDFFAVRKKKEKSGRALRTSTNLRRRDARKKINNDIHGVFNDIHAFLSATQVTIFAGKSVKHRYGGMALGLCSVTVLCLYIKPTKICTSALLSWV